MTSSFKSTNCNFFILTVCLRLFCAVSAQAAGRDYVMFTREEGPFAVVREQGGKKMIAGFIPDLMEQLGKHLNMKVNVQILVNTSDLVSSVLQGKSDIIGPLAVSFVNERNVDLTKPFLTSGIVMVVGSKSSSVDDSYNFPWLPLPPEVFLILKPFSAGIWLLTIFFFVGVSVFFYLIYRFNPRERRYEHEVSGGYDDEFGIFGSFLFAFSCLVWQGYNRAPRSISGRILAAFWWIFIVIFITCYTAKLVFFLNQSAIGSGSENKNGNQLDELFDSNEFTFGVVRNSNEYYFFRQSKIPLYQQMWQRMDNAPNDSFVATAEEGFERARQGNYAFFTNSLLASYVIGREPCDLVQVGQPLSSSGMALGVPKGSDIGPPLSLGILRLRESGVISELQNKWWRGNCPTIPQAGAFGVKRRLSSLRVTEFGGAFILLIIGAILAVIALILEIVFTRFQNRKKTEKQPEETVIADTPAETAKV